MYCFDVFFLLFRIDCVEIEQKSVRGLYYANT